MTARNHRRQDGRELRQGEARRRGDVIEQAGEPRRAVGDIGDRLKIAAQDPRQMRRPQQQEGRQREVWPAAAQAASRRRQQHEAAERQQQHGSRIARVHAERRQRADGEPVGVALLRHRAVEDPAQQRRHRHLQHDLVELGRREGEVVDTLQQHHAEQRLEAREDAQAELPDAEERQRDRELADEIDGGEAQIVGQRIDGAHDPGEERRPLVIAPLPGAPPRRALDHVQRRVGMGDERQERPGENMKGDDPAEQQPRPQRRRAGIRGLPRLRQARRQSNHTKLHTQQAKAFCLFAVRPSPHMVYHR